MAEITLTIGNSYSKISGLTTEQLRKLRRVLSYTTDPQAAYFSGSWIRRKYLIDAKGNFPTGLISRVERFLDKNKLLYVLVETRIKPKPTPGMFVLNL